VIDWNRHGDQGGYYSRSDWNGLRLSSGAPDETKKDMERWTGWL
jgi:hypothetical protein